MGVSDKNVIVCSTLSSILLFSMSGLHLQTFQYGPEEVLRLWVVGLEYFSSNGVFSKIDLHFINYLLLGCVHVHLCMGEHLQRPEADSLALVSLFPPSHGLRAPGSLSRCLCLMSHLLGPLPVI